MKKIILTTVTIIGSFFSFYSQEIVGGLKISPNYALVFDNKPLKDATNKEYPIIGSIGYGLGYYERMRLNDKVELQAEINYTLHNFNRKVEINSIKKNDFWTISFIDIPLIAKRKFNDFSVGLGLMYRKSLSGNQKTEDIVNDQKTITDNEITPKSEFSFVLDLNYKVNKLNLGLRIFRGNSNFLETGNPPIYSAFNLGIDLF